MTRLIVLLCGCHKKECAEGRIEYTEIDGQVYGQLICEKTR